MQDSDVDTPVEEETPETPETPEPEGETPKEETPETPEEETPVKPEKKDEKPEVKKPEVDPEVVRREIAELKGAVDQVSAQVKPKEEEPQDIPDSDLYKDLVPGKEWKPEGGETYSNLMGETLKRTVEVTRRVITQEIEKAAKDDERIAGEDAQTVRTFYAGIDRLRSEGKIPTVTNPNDPNDPGLRAENAMKRLAGVFNTVDVDAIYNEAYKGRLKKKVPKSPVTKPRKGSPSTKTVIDYKKDIQGKKLIDILGDQEEA